jgi:uncharacterized membrane protein
MNQKQIGILIIILAVIVLGVFYFIKVQQDNVAIDFSKLNNGSCITNEGVCLHENANFTFNIGLAIFTFLLALGIYLIYFDKTQQALFHHQKEVSSALKESKKNEKFDAFVSGFNEDEQKAIKAIQEQDGILQSTLRYRTGISKSSLSLLLKSLEERKIISRKVSGKTNKVFLQKKF